MKFKDGIYDNINIDDYHNDREYLSASSLKEAVKSSAHLRYYLDEPEHERKLHLDFGNAFELALMDVMNNVNEFDKYCAIFKESEKPNPNQTFSQSDNKKWKESFFTENNGKYIIPETGTDSMSIMEKMLESCWKDATIQGLLKNTDYQKTIFWTDKETGLKLKTRPDLCKVNKSVIIDLKTTKDASPESFPKDAAKYNYPLQATMQIEGAEQSGLINHVDAYYWIAIEKTAPYNAQIYHFPREDWEWSKLMFKNVLAKVKKAMDSNKWLGYSERSNGSHGILDLELPMWYKV